MTASTTSMRSTRSTQAEFDSILLELPSNRPLVPIAVAMVILNRNEDGVLSLIDDGRIAFAFDLATPGADRRKIHIHRESIESAKQLITDNRSLITLSTLLHRTVPRGKGGPAPLVSVRQLADCFNCSPTHIYNLGAAQCIEFKTVGKAGPTGSALLDRQSVIAFLTQRRIK